MSGRGTRLTFRRLSLKRVLINLIDNALVHGGTGVEVCTYVTRVGAERLLTVSVLDRGPGVEILENDALFSPFIRGDQARSTKGTGLGLAIVKRIADSHGAQVQLLNRVGGGTEARLSFPLSD